MSEAPFHDLPASTYPFTVKFFNVENDEMWHEIEVTGPGVVQIPSGPAQGIKETRIEIHYADGTVETA